MKKFDLEGLKQLNEDTLKLDPKRARLIGGGFAAVILLIIGFFAMNHHAHRMITEIPRTETPMGDSTKLFEKKTATRGNLQFTYYWMHPEGPRAGERFPLVLILHDGDGHAFAAQSLAQAAHRKRYRAYIVAPVMGKDSIWSAPLGKTGGKDQRLAEAVSIVLDQIKQNPIDADRVYIVGCGEGGAGAYGATRFYPGLFAAAMPMNSNIVWHLEDAPSMTHVPMMIVNGTTDANTPISETRTLADAIKKEGGEVKLTEMPDIDCRSEALYDNKNWDWLFAHRKNQ